MCFVLVALMVMSCRLVVINGFMLSISGLLQVYDLFCSTSGLLVFFQISVCGLVGF